MDAAIAAPQLVDQQNAAANNLIAGVYEILMERLATNNALQANDPAGSDVLTEIEKRRIGRGAEDRRRLCDALSGQDFPNKAALLAELKGAIDKADGYRAQGRRRREAGQGGARRRHGEEPVRVAVRALRHRRRRSGRRFSPTPAGSIPSSRRLSNVRILAWNLRDIAGFERSHIAQSISAKSAIPADKLAAISEVRAQVATDVAPVADQPRASRSIPAVAKGLQRAKDGYFAKFQPLADQMRKISAEGAAYPMSTAAMGRHHDAAPVHAARHHVRRRRGERGLYGAAAERRR